MKTRAAVLYQMGQVPPYFKSRPIHIEEIDITPPGNGEVLVEVEAAGICHSDLSVVNGVRPRPTPMALGHEASGVVTEVGANVSGLRPGDHVVFSYVPICGQCEYCTSGRPALCEPGNQANANGTLLDGTVHFRNTQGECVHHHLGVSAFSRYTVVSERSLIKIDPEIPLDKAAIFGCAVLTGVGAVFNTAQVAPGKSVVIFGLGGVGLNAVLAARAAGAWPIIAVDLLESKLQLAKELGATEVVRADKEDCVEAIRELTKGGADYAFEAVGHEKVWRDVFLSTRRGGEAICIGVAAPDVEYRVPAVSLVGEGKVIKGCYMGSSVPSRDIPRFLNMYMAGRLPVDRLMTHTVKLDQINEAFDMLAEGRAVRQLVVFRDDRN